MYEQLTKAPFNLDAAALDWVKKQFESLSFEARLSQLFNIMVMENSEQDVETIGSFQPGGFTKIVSGDIDLEINMMNKLKANLSVPPLVSADLEGGLNSFRFGTSVPNQLGLAAINDVEATEFCADVMAKEAKALGINWTFTPVVDINHCFRSAIVGTRSFGSDIETIESHGRANIRGFQSNGVAAAAKHWPGDGFDDRDQHLVTSVNPLSIDEWEKSFGRLYRSMIEQGVLSIMSAHIAWPEYMKKHTDSLEECWRPASINKLLNVKLLREELGFNGLIVSDATLMGGVSSWADRATVLAETIENGCDMILFCRQPAEDFAMIQAAVRDGKLSERRVNESVIRILGLKAAIGLHQDSHAKLKKESVLGSMARTGHKIRAREINRRCPTLVKDRLNLFPLSQAKHKRVLVFSPGISNIFMPQPIPLQVPDILRAEGFEITEYEPGMKVGANDYDLVLYLIADESALLKSHLYIDWLKLHGGFEASMDRYWTTIPTMMVSFGHPYFLYDAPKMPVYINAYSATFEIQQAVVDAMLGRLPFNQHSPVDAFCNLEQLKY